MLLGGGKRKATASLAIYDIELLKAWYTHTAAEQGKVPILNASLWLIPRVEVQLVILMHDFEQFDTKVVQDLFYICR